MPVLLNAWLLFLLTDVATSTSGFNTTLRWSPVDFPSTFALTNDRTKVTSMYADSDPSHTGQFEAVFGEDQSLDNLEFAAVVAGPSQPVRLCVGVAPAQFVRSTGGTTPNSNAFTICFGNHYYYSGTPGQYALTNTPVWQSGTTLVTRYTADTKTIDWSYGVNFQHSFSLVLSSELKPPVSAVALLWYKDESVTLVPVPTTTSSTTSTNTTTTTNTSVTTTTTTSTTNTTSTTTSASTSTSNTSTTTTTTSTTTNTTSITTTTTSSTTNTTVPTSTTTSSTTSTSTNTTSTTPTTTSITTNTTTSTTTTTTSTTSTTTNTTSTATSTASNTTSTPSSNTSSTSSTSRTSISTITTTETITSSSTTMTTSTSTSSAPMTVSTSTSSAATATTALTTTVTASVMAVTCDGAAFAGSLRTNCTPDMAQGQICVAMCEAATQSVGYFTCDGDQRIVGSSQCVQSEGVTLHYVHKMNAHHQVDFNLIREPGDWLPGVLRKAISAAIGVPENEFTHFAVTTLSATQSRRMSVAGCSANFSRKVAYELVVPPGQDATALERAGHVAVRDSASHVAFRREIQNARAIGENGTLCATHVHQPSVFADMVARDTDGQLIRTVVSTTTTTTTSTVASVMTTSSTHHSLSGATAEDSGFEIEMWMFIVAGAVAALILCSTMWVCIWRSSVRRRSALNQPTYRRRKRQRNSFEPGNGEMPAISTSLNDFLGKVKSDSTRSVHSRQESRTNASQAENEGLSRADVGAFGEAHPWSVNHEDNLTMLIEDRVPTAVLEHPAHPVTNQPHDREAHREAAKMEARHSEVALAIDEVVLENDIPVALQAFHPGDAPPETPVKLRPNGGRVFLM